MITVDLKVTQHNIWLKSEHTSKKSDCFFVAARQYQTVLYVEKEMEKYVINFSSTVPPSISINPSSV